jgi:transglutaminase-like putative cysteine protease
MKRIAGIIMALVLLGGVLVNPVSSEIIGFMPEKSTRKMNITREYELSLTEGKAVIVLIPAMISFWGATNQQIITQSDFTYSEKPDKVDFVSNNFGFPRKDYRLIWNSPKGGKVKVKQTLVVEATCNNTLHTMATLPYPEEITKRFESSLAKTPEINPENPKIEEITKEILKKTKSAEEAVELVCDWINENVTFKSKADLKSDDLLIEKKGNCTGQSQLACAFLRKLGIPTEMASGKFIGGDSGHGYVEVYFPDAGWVFYDLSNGERGFKSLDCVMLLGEGCIITEPMGRRDYLQGYFSQEKDVKPYSDNELKRKGKVRDLPKKAKIDGVKVVKQKPPKDVKVRHLPLCEIIMDESIPPGKREYMESTWKKKEKKEEKKEE